MIDFDPGYNAVSPRHILKPENNEKTGIGWEPTNSSSFILPYFRSLSGLASLSKSDEQVFPLKNGYAFFALFSFYSCAWRWWWWIMCVFMCQEHPQYIQGNGRKQGFLNVIFYVSVLYPMKISQNKTTFDMWGSVLHALGDKRCVRHIQTLQVYYGLYTIQKRKNLFQNGIVLYCKRNSLP